MAVYYIYGTSNSGNTFGIKGFYSPLYLTEADANAADYAQNGGTGTSHPHTFEEVTGVTFYMPTTGAVHPTASDEGSAPTGQFNGETYISYTSPISDADIEPINFGVLAGDTFNSWRRKTNEVARDAILNKASVASLDTRFSRLIDVTGGEGNIMSLTSSDNITGEKEFEGLVKFTAADDLTNAVQIGSNGKMYVSGGKVLFANDIDLHTAGATLKASELDVPTGITRYGSTTYTWPTTAPQAGQILKIGPGNVLEWELENTVEASVEAFLIEDPNPVGAIMQWPATDSVPQRWRLCNGDALNTYTYRALHAVIGNTYGGDAFADGETNIPTATTTFNLPNMGGRIPIGKGSTVDVNGFNPGTFNTVGSQGGEYEHRLTGDESGVAVHTHDVQTFKRSQYDYTGGHLLYGQDSQNAANAIAVGNRPTKPVYNGADGTEIPGNVLNTTATDAISSHNNIQPYIVFNYIIKTESSSIVTQNVEPGNGLLINNQRVSANLLAANSENSITLDVDTDDFEFDSTTGQLKLVDTNYRSGEVIETFGGPCDGRSVTVVSGTHTLPDVDVRVGSSGTTLKEGCKMNYTPPAGTKHVRLEMSFLVENLDNDGIGYFYPSISTESDTTLIPSKYYSAMRINVDGSSRNQVPLVATYTIDSTISSENSSSIYNQMLKSWTTSRAIGFTFNAHGTSYDVRLFEDHNQTTAPQSINAEFSSDRDFMVEPHITITAIAG